MAVLSYLAIIVVEKKRKLATLYKGKAQKFIIQNNQKALATNLTLPSVTQENNTIQSYSQQNRQVDKFENEYVETQIKLLEWAIQSNQKVRFSYEDYNRIKNYYTVIPIEVEVVEQSLYLVSYCHTEQVKINFAIKHIKEAKIVGWNETHVERQPSSDKNPSQNIYVGTSHKTNYKLQVSSQDSINSTPCKNNTIQKRLYINYGTAELEKIVDSEWNNLKILEEISNELAFRSRKKAEILRKRILQRLAQLQDSQFI